MHIYNIYNIYGPRTNFMGLFYGRLLCGRGIIFGRKKQFDFQSVEVTFLSFSSVKHVLSFFHVAQDVKYVQS